MNWGPDGALQPVYQHKRQVVLQKLSRRAQTLKTGRAQSKSGSESREQLKRCQPLASGAAKVNPRPTGGPEERSQTAVCPGSALRPKAPRMSEIPEKMPKFWHFPALNGFCLFLRGGHKDPRRTKETGGRRDASKNAQVLPTLTGHGPEPPVLIRGCLCAGCTSSWRR